MSIASRVMTIVGGQRERHTSHIAMLTSDVETEHVNPVQTFHREPDLTVQIRNPRIPEMQESGRPWTRAGAYTAESGRIYLVDFPNVSNKQTLNF